MPSSGGQKRKAGQKPAWLQAIPCSGCQALSSPAGRGYCAEHQPQERTLTVRLPCPRCGVEREHVYPRTDVTDAEWEAYKRIAPAFLCPDCTTNLDWRP